MDRPIQRNSEGRSGLALGTIFAYYFFDFPADVAGLFYHCEASAH
jgi:hypothetical protein